MPWTKTDYPDSMKNLDPEIRNKAIEKGEEMARKHAASLIVQGDDGKIIDKRSFNRQTQ